MARARNIKPDFFTDEDVVELRPLTRLMFIGMWTLADRLGRMEDRPKQIKLRLIPVDNHNVDDALTELEQYNFILRYEVDGKRYIQIRNFSKHQSPHKDEKSSVIPAEIKNNLQQARDEHGASKVQAPDQHGAYRPDCLNLIPDSGLLIPDCGLPACNSGEVSNTERLIRDCIASKQALIHKNFSHVNIEIETEEIVAKYKSVTIGADPWLIVSRWLKGLKPPDCPNQRLQTFADARNERGRDQMRQFVERT